jgi:hypothetical protein
MAAMRGMQPDMFVLVSVRLSSHPTARGTQESSMPIFVISPGEEKNVWSIQMGKEVY